MQPFNWQIQCKPVPCIWLVQPENAAPKEFVRALSSAPVESWQDLTPVETTVTDLGVAARAASPVASNDSIFVFLNVTELGVASRSAAPVPAHDSIFILAPDQSESVSAKSAAPTPANEQLWIFASDQTESMKARSAAPVPSHSP